MTNEKRQESIENSLKKEFGEFKCNERLFCKFCNKKDTTPCAKAFNRAIYKSNKTVTTIARQKYSWRGEFE